MRSRVAIGVKSFSDRIEIDAPRYTATIRRRGYVSGVAEGSFLDKATGARDLGFGLDIVDFLLEPADPSAPIPPGQYEFGKTDKFHGQIPKRYVEGPQICTQAMVLEPTIHVGPDFVAIRQRFEWNQAYVPRSKAGSVWEQTLIFPAGERFFLACDHVTAANASEELFLRVDLPGHIRMDKGLGFDHVYLSYHDPRTIPSTEFNQDFPPDARFLYLGRKDAIPDRMIRGYQVNRRGKEPGPWLAGMTLDPNDVYQAWCHKRGYVCMIQEVGGLKVKPGDSFGAAYVIGWFDDIPSMEKTYDLLRGTKAWKLDGPSDKPTGYRGLRIDDLRT